MKKLSVQIIIVLVAVVSLACWVAVPLESAVQNSKVIVIGKITSIERAGPSEYPMERRYDIARLTVREVLRDELDDYDVGAKKVLPLSMPSATHGMRLSVDISHEEGKDGIWIIRFRDGAFMASTPWSFQPLSAEKEVRRILKATNAESATHP